MPPIPTDITLGCLSRTMILLIISPCYMVSCPGYGGGSPYRRQRCHMTLSDTILCLHSKLSRDVVHCYPLSLVLHLHTSTNSWSQSPQWWCPGIALVVSQHSPLALGRQRCSPWGVFLVGPLLLGTLSSSQHPLVVVILLGHVLSGISITDGYPP